MNENELLQILAQLRDEPVPVPSVRERVLAHLRPGRRISRLALCTAAAAALFVLTPVPRLPLIPPPPAPRSVSAPDLAFTIPAPAPAKSPVRSFHPAAVAKRRLTALPKPQLAAETFTVKLLTGDPEVVIYWIVEGQGE